MNKIMCPQCQKALGQTAEVLYSVSTLYAIKLHDEDLKNEDLCCCNYIHFFNIKNKNFTLFYNFYKITQFEKKVRIYNLFNYRLIFEEKMELDPFNLSEVERLVNMVEFYD